MSTDQLPQPPEPSWAKRGFDLHQLERYGRQCAQEAAEKERERIRGAVRPLFEHCKWFEDIHRRRGDERRVDQTKGLTSMAAHILDIIGEKP